MATGEQRRWACKFTLPDGEHVIAGFASTKELALRGFQASVGRNPEARLVPETIRLADDPAHVDAMVEDLRAADPSRPLATDLGLDTPERVLTNPEVVPGSQFIPEPKQTFE